MASKRFKKLPEKTKDLNADSIEKLLPQLKKNCTTKFDESLDLSFQINNKQKKSEINIRTIVNLPGGTGKKVKVAVVCEDNKVKDAKLIIEKIVINDQLIDNNKLIYAPTKESKQYADTHPNAVTLHNGNITWPGKIYCYFTVMEKKNVVEQKKLVGQNMMRMYNIIYV